MNTDIIKGKWNQFKGKVSQKWGKFTDNDVEMMKGSKDELIGKIQEKYGYAKDRAEKEVNDFEKENDLD